MQENVREPLDEELTALPKSPGWWGGPTASSPRTPSPYSALQVSGIGLSGLALPPNLQGAIWRSRNCTAKRSWPRSRAWL